jgi:RNA polymerase sigma-70 factor, ECF subfamily
MSIPWSTMLGPVAADDAALQRSRELERLLVERAQSGDRGAIGELLTQHGPGLYRSVLLPRLGSEAAAKDALAETYAKVVERIHQFRWQEVGFYPWLRVVGLRVALDHLRARKRLVLWEADEVAREMDAREQGTDLDQHLSDRRDAEAARAKIADVLERIHPRYARAIRLRILEELPREEVAEALGVSPATFDVLLHRAIAALKKGLRAEPSATTPKPAKTRMKRGPHDTEAGDDDA